GEIEIEQNARRHEERACQKLAIVSVSPGEIEAPDSHDDSCSYVEGNDHAFLLSSPFQVSGANGWLAGYADPHHPRNAIVLPIVSVASRIAELLRAGGGRDYNVITVTAKIRIVRIGNSRGIRIPKTLLQEAELPDEVVLHAEPGRWRE